MTKITESHKEESLTPGEEKEISKINVGERIYREPQNFDHVELTCIGDDGNYKLFHYYTYGGEEIRIMLKNTDFVEAWYDNCWYVKSYSEIIPYEKN